MRYPLSSDNFSNSHILETSHTDIMREGITFFWVVTSFFKCPIRHIITFSVNFGVAMSAFVKAENWVMVLEVDKAKVIFDRVSWKAFSAIVIKIARLTNKIDYMSHFVKLCYFFGANAFPMKRPKTVLTTEKLSKLLALKAYVFVWIDLLNFWLQLSRLAVLDNFWFLIFQGWDIFRIQFVDSLPICFCFRACRKEWIREYFLRRVRNGRIKRPMNHGCKYKASKKL